MQNTYFCQRVQNDFEQLQKTIEKVRTQQVTNEVLSDLLVRNTNGELAEKIRLLEDMYKKHQSTTQQLEAKMNQTKEQSMMVINRQFNIQNQKFEQLMSKKKKKKLCQKGKTQTVENNPPPFGFQSECDGIARNTMVKPKEGPSLANMAKLVKDGIIPEEVKEENTVELNTVEKNSSSLTYSFGGPKNKQGRPSIRISIASQSPTNKQKGQVSPRLNQTIVSNRQQPEQPAAGNQPDDETPRLPQASSRLCVAKPSPRRGLARASPRVSARGGGSRLSRGISVENPFLADLKNENNAFHEEHCHKPEEDLSDVKSESPKHQNNITVSCLVPPTRSGDSSSNHS